MKEGDPHLVYNLKLHKYTSTKEKKENEIYFYNNEIYLTLKIISQAWDMSLTVACVARQSWLSYTIDFKDLVPENWHRIKFSILAWAKDV